MSKKIVGAYLAFNIAGAQVNKMMDVLEIEERVVSRTGRRPCSIDINALKPGAYVLNKCATGVKEIPMTAPGAMPLRFSVDLVLEVRAKYRAGTHSYRALEAEYKINLKQLQQIMRGEFYSIDIKRRENLDVTGEPLSLKGKFTGRDRVPANPRNI